MLRDRYERKARRKRLFVIILSICLVFALGIVIFLKLFELKSITIEGSTRYSQEELAGLLKTEYTDAVTPFFWLRCRMGGIESIPFVEKIEMDMKDRHSVNVTVYEKLVTGCVELRGSYLYFDRDGKVVESSRRRLEDIPLVTGLVFSKIVLGEKLEIQRRELFDSILHLVRLIEKYGLDVSELRFKQDYSVVMYVQECEILLGEREYYDDVMAVLPSLLQSCYGRHLRIDMTLYEDGNNKITAQEIKE